MCRLPTGHFKNQFKCKSLFLLWHAQRAVLKMSSPSGRAGPGASELGGHQPPGSLAGAMRTSITFNQFCHGLDSAQRNLFSLVTALGSVDRCIRCLYSEGRGATVEVSFPVCLRAGVSLHLPSSSAAGAGAGSGYTTRGRDNEMLRSAGNYLSTLSRSSTKPHALQ